MKRASFVYVSRRAVSTCSTPAARQTCLSYHMVMSSTSASPNVLDRINLPTELSTAASPASLPMMSGSTSRRKSRM